jgi:hypothetical protein
LRLIEDTPAGASAVVRLKALEVVSTNIHWLKDNEEELENSFRPKSLQKELTIGKSSEEGSNAFDLKVKSLLSESKAFQEVKNKLSKLNKI